MLYLRFNDERKRQIKEMEESKLLILNEYEFNNKATEKKSLEEIPENEEEDVAEDLDEKSSSKNSDYDKESVKKENIKKNNDINGSHNIDENPIVDTNGINIINAENNNHQPIFQFNKFYNESDKIKKKNSLYDNNSSYNEESIKNNNSTIKTDKLNGDGKIVYSKNINSIFDDEKINSNLDESREINKVINKISIKKLENNTYSNNSSDEPSYSELSNRNVANKSIKTNKNLTVNSNNFNDSKFLIANPQFDQIFANNNQVDGSNDKIKSSSFKYNEVKLNEIRKKESKESQNSENYFDSSESEKNLDDINETFLNKVDEMINFFKKSKVKFEEKLEKNPIKMLEDLKNCKDTNERNVIIDKVALIIQELTSKKEKSKNKEENNSHKTNKENRNDEHEN